MGQPGEHVQWAHEALGTVEKEWGGAAMKGILNALLAIAEVLLEMYRLQRQSRRSKS